MGAGRTHLEATEPDHAVHHLRHTEAVPEVVEGVVPVVVVHAELWGGKGQLTAPAPVRLPGIGCPQVRYHRTV